MADIPFNAHFHGIDFRILLAGANLARDSDVSVRHIPGSNIDFIDLAGPKAPTYDAELFLQNVSDLQSLMDAIGEQDTLQDGDLSFDGAILLKVNRRKSLGTNKGQMASASWVLGG
jgi:hypothetical protein